jgi:hypothetical protein
MMEYDGLGYRYSAFYWRDRDGNCTELCVLDQYESVEATPSRLGFLQPYGVIADGGTVYRSDWYDSYRLARNHEPSLKDMQVRVTSNTRLTNYK